jgi:hypothetical protein
MGLEQQPENECEARESVALCPVGNSYLQIERVKVRKESNTG